MCCSRSADRLEIDFPGSTELSADISVWGGRVGICVVRQCRSTKSANKQRRSSFS